MRPTTKSSCGTDTGYWGRMGRKGERVQALASCLHEVVIRFPRNRFTMINQFWAADPQERIVTLTVPPKARKFVQAHGLPRQVAGTADQGGVGQGGARGPEDDAARPKGLSRRGTLVIARCQCFGPAIEGF
jgi:hypothetical protein